MGQRKINKIGILTSGGDAPGMNAMIRAITRAAIYQDIEVIGFRRGFTGILNEDYQTLESRAVANIIQRGGTILRSARCQEFYEVQGQKRAAENLQALEVDALFIIGGEGSMKGGKALMQHWSGQVIGLPGTIDNDLYGTDFTVGFFTALDTALHAIDKIRDTADAFERIFVIEVMGRHAGFIAQAVGVGAGAEEILIPEVPFDLEEICERIKRAKAIGKASYIIVLSEKVWEGGALALAEELQQKTAYDTRAVVLGHLQRGGSPTTQDRVLGTKLGVYALESAQTEGAGIMVGVINGELVQTDLEKTWTETKSIDSYLERINKMLII